MSTQPSQLSIADPIGFIISLLTEQHPKKNFVRTLEEIPEEVGYFSVYDGIQVRGGGVSWNMRQRTREMANGQNLRRPIFAWMPDTDGSAALWLEGKVRCTTCGEAIDISKLNKHRVRKHGENPDEDEDEE